MIFVGLKFKKKIRREINKRKNQFSMDALQQRYGDEKT